MSSGVLVRRLFDLAIQGLSLAKLALPIDRIWYYS
jgi:hypothetical protein